MPKSSRTCFPKYLKQRNSRARADEMICFFGTGSHSVEMIWFWGTGARAVERKSREHASLTIYNKYHSSKIIISSYHDLNVHAKNENSHVKWMDDK